MNKTTIQHPPCKGQDKGSGPTSFNVQDAGLLFDALGLKSNDVVADIGCGRGEYSLKAAEIVGPGGMIYAFDYWSTYTDSLKQRVEEQGLKNVIPLATDIRKRLPLPDASVSICLLFTVLHATTLQILDLGLGMELKRVVQQGGRIAILELKKEEMPFGPPLKQRLTPKQIKDAFSVWKFMPVSVTDLGYTNLIILHKI